MSQCVAVIVTASSEEEAKTISYTLVDEKLIACANCFPIASVYRWQGEVHEDIEVMLLCKTKESLVDKVITRVKELHSYDVPEIISIPILGGSKDYLKWIDESVR